MTKLRKTFAAAVLALFASTLLAGIVNIAGPRLYVETPSGTDPYAWYPALDLNTIPFHTGSGDWGSQLAIETPTAPTITSSSNAATWAELVAALAVPGRRVTLTADFLGGSGEENVQVSITDVELVIPNGILFANIVIGNYFTNSTITRFKITKASGDTIGGQVHQLRLRPDSFTDIIIDGLQISGGTVDPAIYFESESGVKNRIAIVNNRIISASRGFGFGAQNMVVAGNSMLHDANDADNSGDWGWRQGGEADSLGPYVYYQNDIRGTRYAHIRFHPSFTTGVYYAWVSENVTVSRVEDRFFDADDVAATIGLYDDIDAVWMLNNTTYVNGSVSHQVNRCAYLRVNGNTAYGATSGYTAGDSPNGDASGNTYNAAAGSDPAWGAAGDPSAIDWTP